MVSQSEGRMFYVLESKVTKYLVLDADNETSEDIIENLAIAHEEVSMPIVNVLPPTISVFEAGEDGELAALMEEATLGTLPFCVPLEDLLDVVDEITMEYNEDDLLN